MENGGNRTIKVDVRVLSASNRNIKEDVSNRAFREDLYYRLNVIHIVYYRLNVIHIDGC